MFPVPIAGIACASSIDSLLSLVSTFDAQSWRRTNQVSDWFHEGIVRVL